MNVSAVIVTRGDVDLAPVLDSLPRDWEKVVWDNSQRENLAVYGRYAALEEDCEHELIYVQDDDCILENPAALVEAWAVSAWARRDFLVANMPQRFRDTGFYDDHCLVGFGACFPRDLPAKAFSRFLSWQNPRTLANIWGEAPGLDGPECMRLFARTADVVFTALTSQILLDLPYTDREFASAPNRMWRQPEHIAERTRMLELVRQVRDREAA